MSMEYLLRGATVVCTGDLIRKSTRFHVRSQRILYCNKSSLQKVLGRIPATGNVVCSSSARSYASEQCDFVLSEIRRSVRKAHGLLNRYRRSSCYKKPLRETFESSKSAQHQRTCKTVSSRRVCLAQSLRTRRPTNWRALTARTTSEATWHSWAKMAAKGEDVPRTVRLAAVRCLTGCLLVGCARCARWSLRLWRCWKARLF